MDGRGERTQKLVWLGARWGGRILAYLGGAFAAKLWFTPWPLRVSERGRAKRAMWLTSTEPLTLEIAGHRVRGFTAGRGPTVLLAHGWGDRAASLGAFITPLVSAGFRVVGFDLPAHGDTSKGRTDILNLAAVVREVADRLGDVRAVVAHDTDDAQVDVADSEALVAAWPGARSHITSGLGHDKITRDPEVITSITEFLIETSLPKERELVSIGPSHS